MPLELGKPIERELAGGQSHAYQITLAAGQYLNVIVEQRGIDVVARLQGPDGKLIFEFDSELRKLGQEPVSQVAEIVGNYQLNVVAKEKNAPTGRYEIRVVELRAAIESDQALQEARKLNAEFRKLLFAGKYDEARPLIERALEIREKTLGPEHPGVVAFLNNLADVYRLKGDLEKAEPLLQRAMVIGEKTLGPDHPTVAVSLNLLGIIHRVKGDYAKAESFYRRSLDIREKAFGKEHVEIAGSLNNLANLYREKGDYDKAEPLMQRALDIREKALGSEHRDVAQSFLNFANFYREKGDYDKAKPLIERALAIWEKAHGPEHPDVANAIDLLALLYEEKGEYDKAEPLYQRALDITMKSPGPESPAAAQTLNNMAILYHSKGDYDKAEPLYQRALAIREKSQGPQHFEVALVLNNLALLYRARSDYVRAEQLFQRALAIKEKVFGPEHREVASGLHNLADLSNAKGDYDKAELLYQRALAMKEKLLGPEHPSVAISLTGFAILCHAKGDYERAEPLHQRALAIREKSLGSNHPLVAESLYAIAAHYVAKGNVAQAVSFQSRASVVSEHNIALNLATGSERQKLAYLSTLSTQTDQTVSLHARVASDDPMARSLATATILQRKGRALDATSNSLGALRGRFNAQDRAVLDQLNDTNAQLARLVLGGPQRISPAEHQRRIKALEEQKEKLEADISSRSAEFRAQSQPVSLEAVQSTIPKSVALIEFFSYSPFNAKYTKSKEAYGPPRYVAYALRRQGEAQWVELGEAKVIDEAVDKLRQALRDPQRSDVKRLARNVDRLVMKPLRPLLGDTRQVFLSPDGALNLVPFAALVDERQQYLVNRYSFHYLASGRDLLRLQVKQESKSADLVLADPAYGEKETDEKALAATRDIEKKTQGAKTSAPQLSQSLNMEQVFFRPLPGTAGEAEALKRLLPQARVLTKEQATETVLKQANRPHILHIATHGYFLRDLELSAANTIAGEAPRLPEFTPGGEKIENPLLRSGLALAGANLRRSGEEDGILTALEAAGLDLWGTKLVVLSACDTGVGEVKNGEGVYGLRRALVLAGSETQVMSLWPVSDTATRDLMVDYYRRLQRGEGRGEALRQVQLQMLRNPKRQHPYYWASFIQSGEWANLDGKR
jgi:tetratricopeptide (TPR) repeat protein